MRINLFKSGGNAAGSGGFVSNGLTLQGPLLLSGSYTLPLHAVPKQYVDDNVYNLDAGHVTSGVLPVGRLPDFSGDAVTVIGSNSFTLASVGITAGSYINPTVDAKGRVTAGGTLSNSDINNVAFDKISGSPTTLNGYGITNAVSLSGDTMTGELTLAGDPSDNVHAVTKQYVDGLGGSSGSISIGDIIRKPFTTTPTGFLKCNGALVDKTTYSALYSVIGDNFANYTSIGNGKPWQQQYQINTTQTGDITGWTAVTNLLEPSCWAQPIVTKNRVYLIGGHNGGGVYISTIYTAPIYDDGTLGTWTTNGNIPGILSRSQAIVTKNRVYLLGGYNGTAVVSTVYTAPINSDGTLGTWVADTSLPVPIYDTQAIITKNRVYLIGGYNGAAWVSITYTAPVNSDGTIGAWTTSGSLPNGFSATNIVVTRNRVYLLSGYNGTAYVDTVYTAPINSDGTLGTWTTGTSLPGILALSNVIVTRDKVYLCGGYNGVARSSVTYSAPINSDGTLGTWSIGTPLPAILSQSHTIITKNHVYILGGLNSGTGYLSTVYSAPISGGLNDYSAYYTEDTTNYLMPGSGKPWQQQYQINNTQSADITGWTTGTSIPSPLSGSQVIVTKNRVYLMGGYDGTVAVSTVYTAPINSDGTLGTWSTGTSLPGVLYFTQAIVTKNRVYLLGGYTGSGVVSTVYTASINSDGALGTWTTGTSIPETLRNSNSVITKNRVYLMGGNNGAAITSAVQTAPINTDGTLGAWTVAPSLPTGFGYSHPVVTKNRIYLVGGADSTGIAVSTVYTAPINIDGTLGTWTTGTSLPGSLRNGQVIVTKNRVYIMGGINTTVTISTVYHAPINTDGTLGTWSAGTSLPTTLSNSTSIVTKNRVYLISGWNDVNFTSVLTATISGDLNDYSPYYDGTIVPVIAPETLTFALPDYISIDRDLLSNICSYIKF